MRNILFLTLLFFIYGCGYTSVYKDLRDQDFQIIITEMKGDREMNNLIKNQINLYSNEESIKKFNVAIESKYEKQTLSKNKAGVISNYKLFANSTFTILFNSKTQKINFSETINIENQTNTFEQNLYEKNVKRNFASSIREKLISKITTLE